MPHCFDWQKEFPQVFKRKKKQAFHVTWATHNSRYSERMAQYKVKTGEPVYLSEKEELVITQTIAEIIKTDKLNCLAYNICRDHVHLLIVCEEAELSAIIGKLKSMSARACNIAMGRTALTVGHAPLLVDDAVTAPTQGHAPVLGETQFHLWALKFDTRHINDDEQFSNTIEYIVNNRTKHRLPPLHTAEGVLTVGHAPLLVSDTEPHQHRGMPLCESMACSIRHAFRPEYKGGFDVVIGNPPYVHLEHIKEASEALAKLNYQTYDKRGDLYCLFVERGFQLLKPSGFISYIMPNKWMQAGYGKSLRELFLSKELIKLIDFGDIQIFEDATTYPCIFVARKAEPGSNFSVSVLKSANFDDFFSSVKQAEETFSTQQFSGETWVISSQKEKLLLERLQRENKTLEEFIGGQAYRGILTGLTEAFVIDESTKNLLIQEDPASAELIKPFLQGRDITPYSSGQVDKYLLLIPKGHTIKTNLNPSNPFIVAEPMPRYGYMADNDAWQWFYDRYPAIAGHLFRFREKAETRTDKGDFWWELRACDYYQAFKKPKIMYQTFQVKPCFVYDEKGLFCNNSMWIIPTESIALLALLNSQMAWWLITKYCTQIQNGHQLIWKYFGQIPIPSELPDKLEALADQMISLHTT
jgi:REP element-mobilizing transposase RayT